MTDDPLDTLQRQVVQLQREVTDLKRQVEHEATMRGYLEDRVTRTESTVYGKISRAEAMALLWIALPIGFVMSKPHLVAQPTALATGRQLLQAQRFA